MLTFLRPLLLSLLLICASAPSTADALDLTGGLADVPLYPGAEITQTMSAQGNDVAALSTADAPEQVLDYYKQEMSAAGWSVVLDMRQPDGGAMTFAKDDANLVVTASHEDEATTVMLSFSKN